MGKARLRWYTVFQLCFFSQPVEIHPKAWLINSIHLKIFTVFSISADKHLAAMYKRKICSWGKSLSNAYRLVFGTFTMAATCKLKRPTSVEVTNWIDKMAKDTSKGFSSKVIWVRTIPTDLDGTCICVSWLQAWARTLLPTTVLQCSTGHSTL